MPLVGNDQPICPYCSHVLEKMPGRKKQCPACKKYMLVRTRPADRKKIVIREDQVEVVEEQWSIVKGRHDEFLAKRRERAIRKDKLRKTLGREPSDIELRQEEFRDQHKRRMQEFRDSGSFVTGVEVSAIMDGRTCDHCRRLDGKKYSLAKAPELPHKKCTSEDGCRCMVVPITRIG